MRLCRLWLAFLAVWLMIFPMVPVGAQGTTRDPVHTAMANMAPLVKVGQLVLVGFSGTDVSEASELGALLNEYPVGGVLIRPQNGNLPAGTTPTEFISITNHLQEVSWQSLQRSMNETSPYEPAAPLFSAYPPLFIGMEMDAFQGGYISETVALPTSTALGATWNPTLTESTGQVLGQELVALGVNLFMGPDLDVLYTPRSGDPADLGTESFGGDPFWVGEMGKAFIRGIHAGSGGQVAVISRHFPGLGSVDRPIDQEIPTVQKSLEQLKQIELAPFFAATAQEHGSGVADGLLVSHIRYRGFQGNIRVSTRPISLDAQALQEVMALEPLSSWRGSGGLLIADNLGLNSISRLYNPSEAPLDARLSRRIAMDALSAGNDMIVLDQFGPEGDWGTHFANVRATLDFLAQRYESDAAFQSRVDAALQRVLTVKFRLYPDYAGLDQLLHDPDGGLDFQTAQRNINVQVASQALTRLFPFSEDLLPTPPQEGDRIVIFTQQPANLTGEASNNLPVDMVARRLIRLYGPDGTGQVRSGSVSWFSFSDLTTALDAAPPTDFSGPILSELQDARWIIFATTGVNSDDLSSRALKNFLTRQASLLEGRIVVFAFGPPYDLDSTETSKVDLYYALYSPGEAFVDVAVRALFQDLAAEGDSPVSITGLNYDLSLQVMPDPDQVIGLDIVDPLGKLLAPEDIQKGDVIYLRTSVILDRNGHAVPDGTPVQFVLAYPQEAVEQNVVAETHAGIASTSLTLDRVGQINITARSEPATKSAQLQLTMRENATVIVISTTPTPIPTIQAGSPATSTQPAKAQLLPEALFLPSPSHEGLLIWGVLAAMAGGMAGFLWARSRRLPAAMALRIALSGCVVGLAGYVLLMVLFRWFWPAGLYRLVNREFFVGGIVLVCSVVGIGVLERLNGRAGSK